jgi:hypothetical protein
MPRQRDSAFPCRQSLLFNGCVNWQRLNIGFTATVKSGLATGAAAAAVPFPEPGATVDEGLNDAWSGGGAISERASAETVTMSGAGQRGKT